MISAISAKADGIHKNLVGLQEKGGHRRLEHGVVAEHERYGVGLCMAHGIDDGEPVGGVRHVEIGKQNVKWFRRNKSKGFAYRGSRRHFKAVALQALVKRDADVVFVFR